MFRYCAIPIFLLLTVSLFGEESFRETPWEPDIAQNPEKLNAVIETYFETAACDNCSYKKIENIDYRDLWTDGEKDLHPKGKYRLQIGDQLLISLYGFEEVDTSRYVIVEPTGNISYLFVDSVKAVGRNIDDVRRDLENRIKEDYPNVLVAVTATHLTGDKYTILGEVNLPGTKQIVGEMTLLKAIAEAHGFPVRGYRGQIIDYADLDHAFVARNGEYLPVSFKSLVRHGNTSDDVSLQGGDYIYIPSVMSKSVYVLGEVGVNTIYNYLRTATLTEVIAWSGNLTGDAACYIVVIRGSLDCPTHYLVNFKKIKQGLCPDFVLCPGDIVFVPKLPFSGFRDILKNALRTFVGAVAITAGERAFEQIEPTASSIVNDSIIINPGVTIQAVPVLVP